MTTPRDEATALLAEALATSMDELCQPSCGDMDHHRDDAVAILAASPTLAADLEFAAAWRRVARALPERGMRNLMHYEDYTGKRSWIAECYAEEGARPTRAWDDTPTAALTRLAETLEAMR